MEGADFEGWGAGAAEKRCSGGGAEGRHESTDTRPRKVRRDTWSSPRGMRKVGRGQAPGRQGQAGIPTSGPLDPPPDGTGLPVLTTFKKSNANLSH